MTDTEIGRILKEKSVTIFGAGGLGSNVAIALSRMGVGTLYIVDYDKVEKSNLNRQYYFLKHIGMKKVEALRQVILDIDPDIMVNSYDTRITEENVLALSEGSDIIVEALDEAEIKAM
ncbi:MAG: ThiF family adenylyltransferase, partial [Vallitaleaceae bacterium]|nr:ThiF family adenylyltransferase [Vallitaleaceae bacterium]